MVDDRRPAERIRHPDTSTDATVHGHDRIVGAGIRHSDDIKGPGSHAVGCYAPVAGRSSEATQPIDAVSARPTGTGCSDVAAAGVAGRDDAGAAKASDRASEVGDDIAAGA